MNSQDVTNKLLNMIAKYGHNPQSSSFASYEDAIEYYNAFADWWRYGLGVNVIPANTKLKKYIRKVVTVSGRAYTRIAAYCLEE